MGINSVIVINIVAVGFQIAIDNCSFSNNHVVSIIKTLNFAPESLWGHPISLGIYNTTMNYHLKFAS